MNVKALIEMLKKVDNSYMVFLTNKYMNSEEKEYYQITGYTIDLNDKDITIEFEE